MKMSSETCTMSKLYSNNIPAQNVLKEQPVSVHRVLLRKLQPRLIPRQNRGHRGLGRKEPLGSGGQKSAHVPFLLLKSLSLCQKVWDTVNVTKRARVKKEVKQLTSEMRICFQAFCFCIHSDQLPKLCVDYF